ncbi:MAG: hypothetical protein US86_C0003G0024 [Candidatus Daviesbacteria bacterium GW2011_GWA2_38_24]|uniref:Transglutaminase-like domain-containing protein n=1 Tax=Candidatus Daviesbacteria bacterium GW2011_GWA2_38_24 TaxID=1618422 RepID=A0A0G0MPF5_9BACT|nr:MAG: hypothetical protein US86_C0003G0024 [Candidatus Daviesbacteria bacterium GW2011_GWA2_38_24]
MIRKLAIIILFLVFGLAFPKNTLAAGEFSSRYNVVYDVDSSGSTTVTEKITLKNLTDKYYASSFTLTIAASDLSDLVAFDSSGPLEVRLEQVEDLPNDKHKLKNKFNINVKFNQQLAGKDKEYTWTLKFKSKDFAQLQGSVWQVSVPKVVLTDDITDYNLTLSVPVSFSDPTSIVPEPSGQSEIGGKLNLKFNKDQISKSGILANFGVNQFLKFNLSYKITNDKAIPTIAKIALPPDTPYQEVIINNIDPKPEDVTVDVDGNFLAWFKVGKQQSLDVRVSGLSKLFIFPEKINVASSRYELYTKGDKYWDKDNPAIKAKLVDIFQGKIPDTNQEKARLIHRFVVSNLGFNEKRLSENNFERLGGLTAISNSDNALSSEFTDLFISLSRAANVPSKALVGFAYTPNTALRPLSFQGKSLHMWPEYYDSRFGWVMIDPTWENTTGGVDYFSRFDLNHFVIAINGSFNDINLPKDVNVEFTAEEFKPTSNISVLLRLPEFLYGGFPTNMKISIENTGNSNYNAEELDISSSKVNILSDLTKESGKNIKLYDVSIPPFGRKELEFRLNSDSFFSSFEDIIQVNIAGQKTDQKILVKPFFEARTFPVIVGISVVVMFLGYIVSVLLYLKKSNFKKKKSS